MSEIPEEIKLEAGTLIRHRVLGYEGQIDGTTQLQSCFTQGGELAGSHTKQRFQYRVAVKGEVMRRIAPAEDLEVLEGVTAVLCPGCGHSFKTKPGHKDKPGGRCLCDGWICPSCLTCQSTTCTQQRKRLSRKVARKKGTG